MSREIIEDDVNRLMRFATGDHLLEEVDELCAGVPLGSLALDFPGLHIQRRIQRQGAVAPIFKAVPFQPPRRQRKHRIEPVQRLNRGFLIHAKPRRVLGRSQI